MQLITVSEKNHTNEVRAGAMIPTILENIQVEASNSAFIKANTVVSSISVIRNEHIIPVFIKDNEPVISHAAFVDTALEVLSDVYTGEIFLPPAIRLSHPIKGRVPEAKNKQAAELLEHEKTLYYERMAFIIEIPTVFTDIGGNRLNLTFGGVKAYNLDNLYNKSGADQNFKIFIGFQNKVCTNLCVSTDGYQSQVRAKDIQQLKQAIYKLLFNYNVIAQARAMSELTNHIVTEQQFAYLMGRCRLYQNMPGNLRVGIDEMKFGEAQVNNVCKEYYGPGVFGRNTNGEVTLWQLYNLFTGANKSTYIDSFLDRGANAYDFSFKLLNGLKNAGNSWFIN